MRSNGVTPRSAASQPGSLGRVVRARRRALRLSQLELGDLAGVGPAFLYQLEHGKQTVRLDKVMAVFEVLGLELHVRAGKLGLSVATELEERDP